MANPPFNLFDVLLAMVLVAGIIHGRKRGASLEVIGMAKWLMLLLICAAVYRPLGGLAAESGFFDLLSCYLFAYLGAALLVFFLFSLVERKLAPKLTGSDIFGRGEYFWGMGSGLLQFACILLVALALLNARDYSPAELKDTERFQVENYGSHVFPGLHSLQAAVFERSLTGSWIKDDLSFLLITPTEVNQKPPKSEARARR
jgi:hypothetical protein